MADRTVIDAILAAKIHKQTDLLIQAYEEVSEALKEASRKVTELETILPHDMCVRLPRDLVTHFPMIGARLPQEIHASLKSYGNPKSNLHGPSSSLETSSSPSSSVSSSSSSSSSSPSPSSSSPSSSSSSSSFSSSSPSSSIDFDEQSEGEQKVPVATPSSINSAIVPDQIENIHSADEVDQAVAKNKKHKKNKSKNRFDPYKKAKQKDSTSTIPKNTVSAKAASRETSSRKQKSSSIDKTSSESIQAVAMKIPSDDFSDSEKIKNEIDLSKIASERRINLAQLKSFTPAQITLLDEFAVCAEMRAAATGCRQSDIAMEVRQISNNESTISQSTVSKMLRWFTVPKDKPTVDALKKWITREKANARDGYSNNLV